LGVKPEIFNVEPDHDVSVAYKAIKTMFPTATEAAFLQGCRASSGLRIAKEEARLDLDVSR